jgi:hypothetical protein
MKYPVEVMVLDPKKHLLLFFEPSIHIKDNRVRLTELPFDKYSILAMLFENQQY